MKKATKSLSLAMAGAMALSLAACGGAPAASSTAAASSGEASSTASSEAAPGGDIVTLKWSAVGTGMPANYEAWAAKMNEYLGEKIGVNIEMDVVSWGDWDNRRSVMVNTSGDYDILFTNLNTYTSDVNTGAFADISDLVQTASPDLYAMIPADYWEACRVNGKIYGVPTYKDSSQSEYIVWDKALAAENGIDTASIDSLEKMTPALQKIKDATGDTAFPMYKTSAAWLIFDYDIMSTGLGALGVKYNDKEAKVVPVVEQDDIMARLNTIREWYNAGIVNSDAATKPEESGYRPCMIAQGWSGAAITSWGNTMGVEAEAFKWGPTIVSNDTVRGSLNCISANCKNPEKALAFLQIINTDSWVRDMFYYGLEGEDWEYTADNKVHRINTDWTMAGYTQASFFTVTPTDDVDFNQWDEVKQLNESAEPSVLLGFTFDTSKVSDQLANCVAIYESYKGELFSATIEPSECVANMMAEMRAAGFDEIQAEAQAQVDAFMAAKA